MKSFPFYLSTILYFDFDWTFSEMNPVDWHFETDFEYLTTIPIHYLDLLTNVTKTRITETTFFRIENKLYLVLANPHSIISIHINHYFPLSTNRNHHHPIFLPYLTVSDITLHLFLFIDSFYNQSLLDWWIIDFQTGIVWFFAFIDSISLLKRNMVIDYDSLESINEW